MTQTLRRELRQKVDTVLKKYHLLYEAQEVEEIVDAVLEVRAFSFKPRTIEEAIYAGVPVTEELAEKSQMRDIAPKLFEKSLGFSKPLPWWNGKEWTAFAEWVIERHTESPTCFGEYNIWRNTPYTKGGMANTRIRGFVSEFYDSWDMFMMSREPAKNTPKQEEGKSSGYYA